LSGLGLGLGAIDLGLIGLDLAKAVLLRSLTRICYAEEQVQKQEVAIKLCFFVELNRAGFSWWEAWAQPGRNFGLKSGGPNSRYL